MNTLTKADHYLSTWLVAAGPSSPRSSRSSSLAPFDPLSSIFDNKPRRTLSKLPPTPIRRVSKRRRRKPTSSSIKLPPPSTPFFLRIALGLWSILLAFWRSLVGEIRAERTKKRRRKGSITIVNDVVDKVLVGAGEEKKEEGSSDEGEPDNEGEGTGTDELEQPGSVKKKGLAGDEGESEKGWVDPVTRAPEDQSGVDEPNDDEFVIPAERHVDAISFRLKSAEKKDKESDDQSDGERGLSELELDRSRTSTPERIKRYNTRSSSINSTPTSILENPLQPRIIIPPSSPLSLSSPSSAMPLTTTTPKSRQARLLPNPLSTSLLDPSVPLPISNAISKSISPPPIVRPHTTPFHLQKTLILDLDETLIHSTSRPIGAYSSSGGGLIGFSVSGLLGGKRSRREGHTVEVVLNGRSTTYHVYKRPYVDHFLKKVASWYTLVIYTASMPEYADPVIDWLDAGRSLFAKRLYRDSCFLQNNGSYIKDLALVENDLSRVCFMDNSPISYAWNKANALPIEGWTSDPNDEGLLQSLPVLDCLRFVNDVRRILGIRGFT